MNNPPLTFKFKALDHLNYPYLRAVQALAGLNNGLTTNRITFVASTKTHYAIVFDGDSMYAATLFLLLSCLFLTCSLVLDSVPEGGASALLASQVDLVQSFLLSPSPSTPLPSSLLCEIMPHSILSVQFIDGTLPKLRFFFFTLHFVILMPSLAAAQVCVRSAGERQDESVALEHEELPVGRAGGPESGDRQEQGQGADEGRDWMGGGIVLAVVLVFGLFGICLLHRISFYDSFRFNGFSSSSSSSICGILCRC
jgi:hypothetical protein